MLKKVFKITLLSSSILLMQGCVASYLSIGETNSQCDQYTKELGKCAGISDVLKNKRQYAKEYLEIKKDEE